MNTNLFYFHTLNSIGGVETFFYQLAKKYGRDFDITIMYTVGDKEQVKRLSQYCRVKKWKGETIKCKRCFVAFNAKVLDHVEADEYIQMLHGDYKSLGVIPDRHEKIQRWIAVSKVVQSAYEDITGEKPIVCYNPYTVEKPRKVLRLVSATRLTPDKGLKRMERLADELEKANIPYVWDVYTDSPRPVINENIVLRKPRLNVLDYIADADYYVQLSDSEGYCYSIVEALSVGTPVIVTDIPVLKEIGVINGVNGFVVSKDMEGLPLSAIYKGLKKFKYEVLADKWDELLLPVPPDYEEQMNEIVKVRCKKVFIDLERNVTTMPGSEWFCTRRRAEVLDDLDVIDVVEE